MGKGVESPVYLNKIALSKYRYFISEIAVFVIVLRCLRQHGKSLGFNNNF